MSDEVIGCSAQPERPEVLPRGRQVGPCGERIERQLQRAACGAGECHCAAQNLRFDQSAVASVTVQRRVSAIGSTTAIGVCEVPCGERGRPREAPHCRMHCSLEAVALRRCRPSLLQCGTRDGGARSDRKPGRPWYCGVAGRVSCSAARATVEPAPTVSLAGRVGCSTLRATVEPTPAASLAGRVPCSAARATVEPAPRVSSLKQCRWQSPTSEPIAGGRCEVGRSHWTRPLARRSIEPRCKSAIAACACR